MNSRPIYDRHEWNYDYIAPGRLPISVIEDSRIKTIQSLTCLSEGTMDEHSDRLKNFYQFFRFSLDSIREDWWVETIPFFRMDHK